GRLTRSGPSQATFLVPARLKKASRPERPRRRARRGHCLAQRQRDVGEELCDLIGGGGTVGALDVAPVEWGREQVREGVQVLGKQGAAGKGETGRLRGHHVI